MIIKDKKNVAVLVKGIIEKDPSMIRVKDSALIPYYTHNSNYMIEVEPEDKSELRFLKSCRSTIKEDFDDLKSGHLGLAKELNANYIFASTYYETHGVLVSVTTPFMVISENETDFLLKNYYKNVPEEVSEAASSLGITLFDKYYLYYLKNKIFDLYPTRSKESREYLHSLKFFFSLPYDEQNIGANKKILEYDLLDLDAPGILVNEYSQGKYFQEYFGVLSESAKKKLVSQIKTLERNKDNDIFLLKRGFVVGEPSAVELYKADAKAFIDYFEKISHGSKKVLIEKLYEEQFVNQEVVAWLEENYMPLLREVGFAGGKQDGTK